MDRTTFGRRGCSQPLRTQERAKTAPALAEVGADDISPALDKTPSLDEELRTWKQQRSFTMPWTQLCLMASICFGVASFVLPAGVSSAVDWLLYGLTGMSLYVWFTGRRARGKS